MPKALSEDLRRRVVGAVSSGATRRAAAERFGVSVSSAVKWFQRLSETGSVAAKPARGSRSKLDDHAAALLALIEEQPDLTLDEVHALTAQKGITTSRSALWRFFGRHGISFKKKPARQRTGPARRRPTPCPMEEIPEEARSRPTGVHR
jgi:transposase